MNAVTSFKPLLNRVLIKRLIQKQKTAGGLILGKGNQLQRFGLVVETGPGVLNTKTGKLIPPQVKVGEYVLLPDYNGSKVEIKDEDKDAEYLVYRDTEILGALEGAKL